MPSKEEIHIIIDVFHEIEDLHAQNSYQKEKNKEIAMALKCLAEILENSRCCQTSTLSCI